MWVTLYHQCVGLLASIIIHPRITWSVLCERSEDQTIYIGTSLMAAISSSCSLRDEPAPQSDILSEFSLLEQILCQKLFMIALNIWKRRKTLFFGFVPARVYTLRKIYKNLGKFNQMLFTSLEFCFLSNSSVFLDFQDPIEALEHSQFRSIHSSRDSDILVNECRHVFRLKEEYLRRKRDRILRNSTHPKFSNETNLTIIKKINSFRLS